MSADLAGISGLLANASLANTGFEPVLARIAELTGSKHGHLVSVSDQVASNVDFVTDFSPAAHEAFYKESITSDANWRIASRGAPMEIICERHYAIARQTRKGNIYDQLAHEFDIANGCQTMLVKEPGWFMAMAVLRTAREGHTDGDGLALFARVAPMVRDAVLLQRAIQQQGAALLAGTFDAMQATAFICDGAGRVRAMTAAAEVALPQLPVSIVSGRLSATHPRDHAIVHSAMWTATHGQRPGSAGASSRFFLQGRTSASGVAAGKHWRCEVLPLPRLEHGLGFEPRAVVVLRRETAWSGADGDALRSAWKLTQAEAEIALLLAAGKSREDIAFSRGSSPATLATQIKSIFAKCGARREGEFVAMVRDLLG